ncbi:hypothetical protein HD806DRAFT_520467 [Xylariaceae sp. AK1471]|nr:hypothetical protein HD806DRAFT_520467 [Xylariaceae sp. AK1471]
MEFYPLDFLREVVQKVGALFFATIASDLATLNLVVDTNNEGWVPRDPYLAAGSMLPFRSIAGYTLGPDYTYTKSFDHPVTTPWLLRHDGSVSIEFAGIISRSKDPLPSTQLRASIRVPGHFSTGISERRNLYKWVRDFRLESSCADFAVSLYQQPRKVQDRIF